jgi:RHS repeat-associated protein
LATANEARAAQPDHSRPDHRHRGGRFSVGALASDLSGSNVVAAGRIDLAWSASTDNVAVAGYAVYRDGTKITTVPVGSTSYSDTGLTPGVSHTYTITALDAAANESAGSGSWSGAASDAALLTSYAYDAANRLTSVATGGQTLGTYTYDGAGDRIAKTTAAGSTAYTLDLASGLPQVLSETTGASTSAYAYAGGPLELDVSGSTYWYLADSLGSVRLVTDASGDTPATYAYAAFGSTRSETGSLPNEVRFTGERTDAESGLQYLNARTYDPATGTFLQRDTWGITATDGQSIDPYAYTQNSPVNLTDPSGHCPMCLVIAGVELTPEVLAVMGVTAAYVGALWATHQQDAAHIAGAVYTVASAPVGVAADWTRSAGGVVTSLFAAKKGASRTIPLDLDPTFKGPPCADPNDPACGGGKIPLISSLGRVVRKLLPLSWTVPLVGATIVCGLQEDGNFACVPAGQQPGKVAVPSKAASSPSSSVSPGQTWTPSPAQPNVGPKPAPFWQRAQ